MRRYGADSGGSATTEAAGRIARRVRRFKVSRETMKEADPKRQERNKRYRTGLEERGIKAFQVVAPETAKGLFRRAAELMTRDNDPMEPRQAMRLVGGANEPELGDGEPALIAELDEARKRIAEIERQAEARRVITAQAAERHRQMLEAERDAARAAEAAERQKVQAIAMEAMQAQERVGRVETVIQQVKTLPGIKGRLVRWLAGDILPD